MKTLTKMLAILILAAVVIGTLGAPARAAHWTIQRYGHPAVVHRGFRTYRPMPYRPIPAAGAYQQGYAAGYAHGYSAGHYDAAVRYTYSVTPYHYVPLHAGYGVRVYSTGTRYYTRSTGGLNVHVSW